MYTRENKCQLRDSESRLNRLSSSDDYGLGSGTRWYDGPHSPLHDGLTKMVLTVNGVTVQVTREVVTEMDGRRPKGNGKHYSERQGHKIERERLTRKKL